jgi:predicted HicB family RNase H-like nuclease
MRNLGHRKRLTLRLPSYLTKQLEKIAEKRGISLNQLINEEMIKKLAEKLAEGRSIVED